MAEFNKEGLGNVMLVAVAVCLVCSIIVSTAAVALKPQRLLNQQLDRKQNILRAAGMLPQRATVDAQGRTVDELFAEFEVRAINLDTGEYVEMDVTNFDPVKAAKVTDLSSLLAREDDLASLGRRENVSLAYVKRTDGALDRVVIPVRGAGLWGTMFGYLALKGDVETIAGIGFYAHKETPGLGGEIDNPNWRAGWDGVQLFAGESPDVRLVKSRSAEGSAAANFEVDALSGATFTTRGVQNLVNFWTGENGFGPYLTRLRSNG